MESFFSEKVSRPIQSYVTDDSDGGPQTTDGGDLFAFTYANSYTVGHAPVRITADDSAEIVSRLQRLTA